MLTVCQYKHSGEATQCSVRKTIQNALWLQDTYRLYISIHLHAFFSLACFHSFAENPNSLNPTKFTHYYANIIKGM